MFVFRPECFYFSVVCPPSLPPEPSHMEAALQGGRGGFFFVFVPSQCCSVTGSVTCSVWVAEVLVVLNCLWVCGERRCVPLEASRVVIKMILVCFVVYSVG